MTFTETISSCLPKSKTMKTAFALPLVKFLFPFFCIFLYFQCLNL